MPGEMEPNSNTTAHCVDGESFVVPGKSVPYTHPINDVVEFLSYLYDNGGRFGVIATARNTLGNFIHVPGVPVLANHPYIQKVVKGAYNTRTPAPCYIVIWDADVLLKYLDSLDNTSLNLSIKTILLTILSGQWVSIIHAFQLQQTTDMAIFNLDTTLLKHSRPGRSNPPIVFHRYPHGHCLCPLQAIQDYVMQHTLLAPQIDKFFITHHKPYHPASKDMLARWVKDMHHLSGFDTLHYAAHSCRSASSSKVKVSGVPMEQILKCVQWKSSHTFVRFYKDIVQLTQQFAASILVSEVAGDNTLPLTFFPFQVTVCSPG